MNKFTEWISGFRKKDYDVQLATEANLSIINLDVMDSIFESMSRAISNFTCRSASFAINDFKATKITDNPMLRYDLSKKKDSISHIKVSRCGLDFSERREIVVSTSIFSLGLDGNIWRFDIKASTFYTSLINDIEPKVIDVLIEYINGFIESMQISKMCVYDVHVDDVSNYNSVYAEMYSGWVKSFCNDSEYQNFMMSTVQNMVTEADTLVNAVTDEDVIDAIENDSMIVDVIRRKDLRLKQDVKISDVFSDSHETELSISDLIEEPEYDHKISVYTK